MARADFVGTERIFRGHPRLDLHNTRVTDDAVKELQKALPGCYVYH